MSENNSTQMPMRVRRSGSSNFKAWRIARLAKLAGKGVHDIVIGERTKPWDPTVVYDAEFQVAKEIKAEHDKLTQTEPKVVAPPTLPPRVQPTTSDLDADDRRDEKFKKDLAIIYQILIENLNPSLRTKYNSSTYSKDALILWISLNANYGIPQVADRWYEFRDTIDRNYAKGDNLEEFIEERSAKIQNLLNQIPSAAHSVVEELLEFQLLSSLPASFKPSIRTLFANHQLTQLNVEEFYQALINTERSERDRGHATSGIGLNATQYQPRFKKRLTFAEKCMKRGCGVVHGTREKFYEAHPPLPPPPEMKAKVVEEEEVLELEEYDEEFHVPPEVQAEFGVVARAMATSSPD